jgi:hypothetical protein
MKLFKTKIPKEDAQEVTELQSWTLKWEIQGDMYHTVKTFFKTFITLAEAKEYEKQLKVASDLLRAWVETSIYQN